MLWIPSRSRTVFKKQKAAGWTVGEGTGARNGRLCRNEEWVMCGAWSLLKQRNHHSDNHHNACLLIAYLMPDAILSMLACMLHAKSLQSCSTLCNPMDCTLPGSLVCAFLQARRLEWVAMTTPRDLPNPRIEPTFLMSPALAGGLFTVSTTWEA